MRIRTTAPKDLDQILDHRVAMFREMGYGTEESREAMRETSRAVVEDWLQSGQYRGWFAEDEQGRVIAGVGLILYRWLSNALDDRPERAYILNVYVEPEHRGRGLAKALLKELLGWCQKQGFTIVSLHASEMGKPVYERLGFTSTNEMRLRFDSEGA